MAFTITCVNGATTFTNPVAVGPNFPVKGCWPMSYGSPYVQCYLVFPNQPPYTEGAVPVSSDGTWNYTFATATKQSQGNAQLSALLSATPGGTPQFAVGPVNVNVNSNTQYQGCAQPTCT